MDQETAVSSAKDIADRILAPAARQNDKDARFSSEAVAALGSSGLLAITLPTDIGGSGLGPLAGVPRLSAVEVARVGDDVLITGRLHPLAEA